MAFLVEAAEPLPPGGSIANAVAVDGAGNALLTGYFEGTVDFDPNGGTAFEGTNQLHAFFLAKHDADGALDWVATVDAAGSTAAQVGRDVAVDAAGNVFATGMVIGPPETGGIADFDEGPGTALVLVSAQQSEMFLARYDADGMLDWVLGAVGAGGSMGEDLAVVGGNDIAVAGRFQGTIDFDPDPGSSLTLTGGGIYVARYESTGEIDWAIAIQSQPFEFFGPNIAAAGDGGLYLAGGIIGTADFDPGAGTALRGETGERSAVLARYDANGSLVWAVASDQTAVTGAATLADVAVAPNGDVVVVGAVQGTVDLDPGTAVSAVGTDPSTIVHFLAKYDSDGSLLWANTIEVPASVSLVLPDRAQELAPAVSIDGAGNIALAFNVVGETGTFDIDPGPSTVELGVSGAVVQVLSGYDANGNFQWAAAAGGDGTDGVASSDVASDPDGQVWLTGVARGSVIFVASNAIVPIERPGIGAHFLALYGADGGLGGNMDTVPPAAPEVLAIADDTDTPNDRVTTDRTLTVSGTAEADSTVHVFRDNVEIGTAAADPGGAWTFVDPAMQAFGAHRYKVRAEDADDNLSPFSTDLEYFVVNPAALPTNGPDLVMGNAGANQIQGAEGNDTIFGEAGNDTVRGNNGNDWLFGGEGSDRLEGGNGADTARGGNGTDTVYGENGNDRLFGEAGNDRLEGGAGLDHVDGGPGNDTVYGGIDTDTILGDLGADLLFGDAGGDRIHPGVDTVRDTIGGSVAHLTDDTIDGFIGGSPATPGADLLLISGLTNAQRAKLDGDALDAMGRLSLAEVGGGVITFLGHAGAEVDAVYTAGGVQIWLIPP